MSNNIGQILRTVGKKLDNLSENAESAMNKIRCTIDRPGHSRESTKRLLLIAANVFKSIIDHDKKLRDANNPDWLKYITQTAQKAFDNANVGPKNCDQYGYLVLMVRAMVINNRTEDPDTLKRGDVRSLAGLERGSEAYDVAYDDKEFQYIQKIVVAESSVIGECLF